MEIFQEGLWKNRFNSTDILWTELALNNPERGLIVSNQSGSYQLYTWDLKTNSNRQVTYDNSGAAIGTLSPDGQFLYYFRDQDGKELGHWIQVAWDSTTCNDLSPNEPLYASNELFISQTGNRIGFTRANDFGFFTVVNDTDNKSEIKNTRVIYESSRAVSGPVLSPLGEYAVIAAPIHSILLDNTLILINLNDNGNIYKEIWDGEGTSIKPISFSPNIDDLLLLASTNVSGRERPIIWDIKADERINFDFDNLPGDITPWCWSPDGHKILLCYTFGARQRIILYDLQQNEWLWLNHPQGTYFNHGQRGTYFTPNGEIFAQIQRSSHPTKIIALDSMSGRFLRNVFLVEPLIESRPWKSVTFSSSDNTPIQGWLGLPSGKDPFPFILHMHGGPQSAMMDIFLPSSQAWIDKGFGWFSINYRGSTSFGKSFESQIWGNLGYWELEDMLAARAWLVKSRLALEDGIFPTGYSYGGYLTLLALGKYPNLWAGGIAQNPVADFTLMYEDSSAYIKGYLKGLFGGTPKEKADQYKKSSPIYYESQVISPILIFQGRNDSRCPPRQVELYETKLKQKGKEIEVIWSDAGHASPPIDEQISRQESMINFASRVLRGVGT